MPKQLPEDWMPQLKSGDTRPLQQLLELFGDSCVRQLLHIGVKNRNEAEGLFLDALLALREKIMDGRLESCDAPGGYLFGTARNMFRKAHQATIKKQNKQDDVLRYYYDYESEFDLLEKKQEAEQDTKKKQQHIDTILKAFQQLNEKCQRILKLFYVENQNMEIIAQQLNLKNAQTAKATKFRCMRKWHDALESERE